MSPSGNIGRLVADCSSTDSPEEASLPVTTPTRLQSSADTATVHLRVATGMFVKRNSCIQLGDVEFDYIVFSVCLSLRRVFQQLPPRGSPASKPHSGPTSVPGSERS